MKRTWQKLLNQQPGRKKLVDYFQKARPWVPPSRLSGEMDLLRPQIDEKFGLSVCKINLRFLCIWCSNNNRVSPIRNPMWRTLKHLTSDIIKHRPSNLHACTSLLQLWMVQRETHLTPIKVSMVRRTSDKQISRTFQGIFKDKLQF